MKATFELIQQATVIEKSKISLRTSISERESILIAALKSLGIKNVQSVGEVPSKGANLSIISLKNAFRVNFRCGYGRNNYAPCVEISK